MNFELWKRKWEKDIFEVNKEIDMKQFREQTTFVLDALKEDGFLIIQKAKIKDYFPKPIIRFFKKGKEKKEYHCANCGIVFEEKNGMVQFKELSFDTEKCYQDWKNNYEPEKEVKQK